MGSSLKYATCLSLPCDTWHRSFHLGISQPQFCPADIPLSPNISQSQFCPADILPHPDISHSDLADVPPSPGISHPTPAAGWERRTIQLPRTDMSGSSGNAYPYSFPGQLGSSDTCDSPDPFPPTIKKHRQY